MQTAILVIHCKTTLNYRLGSLSQAPELIEPQLITLLVNSPFWYLKIKNYAEVEKIFTYSPIQILLQSPIQLEGPSFQFLIEGIALTKNHVLSSSLVMNSQQ